MIFTISIPIIPLVILFIHIPLLDIKKTKKKTLKRENQIEIMFIFNIKVEFKIKKLIICYELVNHVKHTNQVISRGTKLLIFLDFVCI